MFVYAGSAGTPKEKGSVTGNGEGIYMLYWDGKQDLRVIDAAYAKNAGIICMSMDHLYMYPIVRFIAEVLSPHFR